jgi:hypothetical protein
MIFSLSRYFLISTALVVSFKSYAADNPVGTTLTSTLTGSSPITNEGTISGSIYGISNNNDAATITNSGTISVSGANNHGISSYASLSNITNSGLISVSGVGAIGIIVWDFKNGGNITNTINGVIEVSGWTGIALSNNNSVLNNYGSITGNSGIIAFNPSSTVNNFGRVVGTEGNAISFQAINNTLNLYKGSVIVGNIYGNTGSRLNIELGSGASYAFSTTGTWTVSDLDNRPMVTGSAYAAGVGNITTASQSLYERTSQITQSIDDRLRTHDLKQQASQDFWMNTYYSDSSRGGQGLSGSNLSFNQYRSGITAGFNVKNSYTPTELIVNYEHGKLNIDEGNQGISSNSVMAGALFPDIKKLFTGTLSAKAMVGYSDFSGDRKVLTNDIAFNGSRNVTASYQSSHLTIGSAWTKTLYQTDKVILDTLVGIDLNTQHINSYSESDLFKWNGRTINQLQERVTLGMEMKPFVKPLTLFGRVGVERRDLISGENQNYAINNTAVSYNDSNQRNTYATLNAGAYYPLTQTVKAYAQVRYYDSTKDIDSLSGSIGISGQF